MSQYEMVFSFRCPHCLDSVELLRQTFTGVVGRPMVLQAHATITVNSEHVCLAKLAEIIVDDVLEGRWMADA